VEHPLREISTQIKLSATFHPPGPRVKEIERKRKKEGERKRKKSR